jgi:hypothetical protein
MQLHSPTSNRWITFSVIAFAILLLWGCTPGSEQNDIPVAEAGPDISARFGSEVALSGRDSYDPDGPVMLYRWRQVAGPESQVLTVNNSTIRVKVPALDEDTDLLFELTVTDNRGATASDQITIRAKTPADPDRFLTFFSTPDAFVVEAVLNDNDAIALGSTVHFTAVVEAWITYRNLDGETRTVKQARQRRPGSWTGSSGNQGVRTLIGFDVPAIDLLSLLDANDALRSEATVEVVVTLEELSEPVSYGLYLRDVHGGSRSQAARIATASVADTLIVPYQDLLKAIDNGVVESRERAEAYYRAIDPDNRKTNLGDWLKENGFTDNAGVVEARYMNGFDLGFGRHMKMRVSEEGYVFASVSNYPSVDAMVAGTNLIANVAMEYSPGPDGGEPFTKFYTFAPNPETGAVERVLSMDFDGRGEKFTPGNCAVCHGGRPLALDENGNYPNGGNIGSRFMLWDVDTFAFSDAEYEGRKSLVPSPYRRADQEAAFKFFNTAILQTNLTDAQRELAAGWYGGEDMPDAKFNGNYVPPGWRTVDNGGPLVNPYFAEELYTEVVGPTCRACHLGIDSVSFSTYANFAANHSGILRYVYDEGVMPMARVTMDNFWVERFGGQSRADKLAGFLSLMDPVRAFNPGERKPGRPLAKIALRNEQGLATSQGNTGVPLELDGTASLFADTYQWQLAVLPDPGLPAELQSNATVVNDTQAIAWLNPDVPGIYSVTLRTAKAELASEATLMFTVPDLEPFARSDDLPTAIDGNPLQEDFTEMRFDVLANDELGNLPITLTVTSQGGLGEATVADNGTPGDTTDDYILYSADISATSAPDQFGYQVVDADGDADNAVVRFTLNQSADGPSRPVINSISASKPSPRVFLQWTASDAPQAGSVAGYRVQRRVAANGTGPFTEIAALDSSVNSYTDEQGAAGTSYHYRVKALTAQGGFSVSAIATIATLALPTMPPGAGAQAVANRPRVRLSWQASSYSEGGSSMASYRIERKLAEESDEAWNLLASVGHSSASAYEYVDDGLAFSTNYVYRLIAVGTDAAESPPTAALATATGVTDAPNNPPDAPLWAAVALPDTAAVYFTVTVPADNDGTVDTIALERSPAGEGSYTEVTQLNGGAAGIELTYTDITGIPNTSFDYRLIAVDDEGGRTTTSVNSVLTGNTPPEQPVITSAVVDTSGATPIAQLQWQLITDPDTGAAVTYQMSRQTLAAYDDEPDENTWGNLVVDNVTVALNNGLTSTSLTDNSLTAGLFHIYRITAMDANGGISPATLVRTQNLNQAPAAVTDLTADPDPVTRSVTLAWTQPQDDAGVVLTKIYRVRNEACSLDSALSDNRLLATYSTNQASGQPVSYADTAQLCSAASYQYFVVAVDNLGVESALSNVAAFDAGATTYNAAPGQPALTVTRSNEVSAADYQLQLAVTGGEDADIDDAVQFKVYRNGMLINTIARAGSPTTYTDAGVDESIDNSYTVVATDGLADSAASTAVKEPPLVSDNTYATTLNTDTAGVHTLDITAAIIPAQFNLKGNSADLYDELQVTATSPGAGSFVACNETMPSSKASDTYSVSKLCVGDSGFAFRLRYGSYWTPSIAVDIGLRTANSMAGLGLKTVMGTSCAGCHATGADAIGEDFSTDGSARNFLQNYAGTGLYAGTFVTTPDTRFASTGLLGMYVQAGLSAGNQDLFEAWISHGQHCKPDRYTCD